MEAADAARLRRKLRAWYSTHGRHNLPWRLTRDPYAVLISEVMLQQTQVDRVLPYYTAWLKRWPTVAALADASPADVIRAWSGLGYNRRALNLHRAATAMAAGGAAVPTEVAALIELPGIGPYTASAVASFAGERRVAVVDTNIGRLIARALVGFATVRDVPIRTLAQTAELLLPQSGRAARDHNLAFMDFGALVCESRRPDCDSCPLRSDCAWRRAGYPTATRPSAKAPRFEGTARFARGRIVEALRGSEFATVPELASRLPTFHAARIEEYLAALARDGLIERRGEHCSLAGGTLTGE